MEQNNSESFTCCANKHKTEIERPFLTQTLTVVATDHLIQESYKITVVCVREKNSLEGVINMYKPDFCWQLFKENVHVNFRLSGQLWISLKLQARWQPHKVDSGCQDTSRCWSMKSF